MPGGLANRFTRSTLPSAGLQSRILPCSTDPVLRHSRPSRYSVHKKRNAVRSTTPWPCCWSRSIHPVRQLKRPWSAATRGAGEWAGLGARRLADSRAAPDAMGRTYRVSPWPCSAGNSPIAESNQRHRFFGVIGKITPQFGAEHGRAIGVILPAREIAVSSEVSRGGGRYWRGLSFRPVVRYALADVAQQLKPGHLVRMPSRSPHAW